MYQDHSIGKRILEQKSHTPKL